MADKDAIPARRAPGARRPEGTDDADHVEERLIDRVVRLPDDAVQVVRAQEALVGRVDLADARQPQVDHLGTEVVELGALNRTIHQIDECIAVEDLGRLARVYRRILENLLA